MTTKNTKAKATKTPKSKAAKAGPKTKPKAVKTKPKASKSKPKPKTPGKAPSEATIIKTIEGVTADMIKPELVRAALEEVGLDATGEVAETVPRLMGYYKGNYTADELIDCDCGGYAVDEDEACPFCGDPVIDDVPAGKKPPAPSKNRSAVARKGKDTPAHKPGKPKDKTNAIESVDEETRLAREKFKPEQLAEFEAVVHETKAAAASGAYQLGKALERIYEHSIWRIANDSNGRPFKAWKAYVEQTFDISRKASYDIMLVVANFDEPTFIKIGPSKLIEIHRAPEKLQPALLTDARAGATQAALRQRVRDSKESHSTNSSTNSSTNTNSAPKRVTCVAPTKATTVPMYVSRGRKKGDDDIRAARLNDEPQAVFEFDNGSTMTGTVVVKDGKISLKLKFATK